MKLLSRPVWSRTFIEEPEELRDDAATDKQPSSIHALLLSAISIGGLVTELCLFPTSFPSAWIVCSAMAWALLLALSVLMRPRCFSAIICGLFLILATSQSLMLIKAWPSTFDVPHRLLTGTSLLSVTGLLLTLNMPMRDPLRSRSGIGKLNTDPSNQFRSPEDDLSFWQWMTVGWVSPLLALARKRQLNGEDVWLLPHEFQHALLHDAFRRLNGSVFRRIMIANWVDLAILSLLELVEVITQYSQPLLLQSLLKSMQHLETEKRSATIYALLILIARLVNAQTEVFSLWYERRCYERSRGELITMIYEKTLHRKVVAQPQDEGKSQDDADTALERIASTRSTDENTPLIAKDHQDALGWPQRIWLQVKSVWSNFRVGFKGVDARKQGPAGLGRILNAMRYDAYEVAQRFWDFQKLIEKPLGLVISLVLICRLLGWPALIGVAVILSAQIINYLLVLVDVRLETVRRAALDKRLQQTSQFIEYIRHLRWYGWQRFWLKNVFKARRHELNMRIVTYLWTQLVIFNNVFCSGFIIVAAFWAYTTLAGRPLGVEIIFPALQIFDMVQSNMAQIPNLIQSMLNANVALKRIQSFMDEPDKEEIDDTSGMPENCIEVRGATFAWPGIQHNVLHELHLKFGPGFNVVTGEVASGKTALLQALLGELDIQEGSILKPNHPIAYCAQTSWLQSMSIRDNILFNAPLQLERYQKTLEACALVPDLAAFENGDLSSVGENGIGLSGGQKARVALARAIYSDAQIVLLDDPLSALDQQTSEHIVTKCLRGDLVVGRTVVLVTHRVDLCVQHAVQVVNIALGRAKVESQLPSTSALEDPTVGTDLICESSTVVITNLPKEAVADKFEDDEKRAHGEIKGRVYWEYLKAGTLSAWVFVILTVSAVRLADIATSWFLKEFGESYQQELQQHSTSTLEYLEQVTVASSPLHRFFDWLPNPRNNVSPWLLGLLFLTMIEVSMALASQCAILIARYFAGKNLFRAVMEKIANTTFRYYDITPSGLLLNRLTSDIGQVDAGVASDLYWILLDAATWIFSLLAVAFITPLFLVISILLTILFVMVFFYFLPASQSLRRLETVSLSPLMTNFGALLAGLTTVRAFHAEGRFQASMIKVVDHFQGMDHFYWSVQSWLSYRLDILSAVSTFVLTIVAVYTNLSAGLTAFVLVTAQRFVGTTHSLCRGYGTIQVNFVSVERVVELLDIDQEPSNPVPPPAWWPSYGASIIFENVTIRYAPQFDPALTDLSFEIKGGTNTAIVGRTGSGKSTLAAALLATVPVEKGRILIDGVDLATVDRQALRTRVTFLAQEPVLFEGTLRHNLDPTKEHSDQECKEVLERVAGRFGWKLTTPIEAGGKNLSQGQRQLVGLSRAILRRSSIIIMDEATASIDVETAWEIQRILREELKGSTVITIAHKTAAVRGANNTIVLANGKLVSFGPAKSMSNSTGDEISA